MSGRRYSNSTKQALLSFGRGRCYYPGCDELRLMETVSGWRSSFHIAHIHAANPGGQRYLRSMTDTQRDDFANLILLCGPHHEVVDAPDGALRYPAEELRRWKVDHEKVTRDMVSGPASGSEPPYWATVRARRRRTDLLSGRGRELEAIAAFATGEGGYYWLSAGPFAGKTTLLAEAALRLHASADSDVICYFLSRIEADADREHFLIAVVPQLARLLDDNVPLPDYHSFRSLWERASARAASTRRHLILVVDGLDEDLPLPGAASVAAALPETADRYTHILVSSRPHPLLPQDVPGGHALRRTAAIQLTPFEGSRELADLARQEITHLVNVDEKGFATTVLGILTAAAGPLTVSDLAAILGEMRVEAARKVRRIFSQHLGRSIETLEDTGDSRYQFAHLSLLEFAQEQEDLCDPAFREHLHDWAARWRARGWVRPGQAPPPRYLLDSYLFTLSQKSDASRLAALVTDPLWLCTAVRDVGVDAALAHLRRAGVLAPEQPKVAALTKVVAAQAHHLRHPHPVEQSAYVLRQLCLQAMEFGLDTEAEILRDAVETMGEPGWTPLHLTSRTGRYLAGELGHHDGPVVGLTTLRDGRVVSTGEDGLMIVWDPDDPLLPPVKLHGGGLWVTALVELADGRIATNAEPGLVCIHDLSQPDAPAVKIGNYPGRVCDLAVLPNGQLATVSGLPSQVDLIDPAHPDDSQMLVGFAGDDGSNAMAVWHDRWIFTGTASRAGSVFMWDLEAPGKPPIEVGRHEDAIGAMTVLHDGRIVVTGDLDDRISLWDPYAEKGAPGITLAGILDDIGSVLATLADGRLAISGGIYGKLVMWDPRQPESEFVPLGHHSGGQSVISALQDGRFVTGAYSGRLQLWETAEVHAQAVTPVDDFDHDGKVCAVGILPDGRIVIGGGIGEGWLAMFDPADAEGSQTFFKLPRRCGPLIDLAVLPDGRIVTSGGIDDGQVFVWNPSRPERVPQQLDTANADDRYPLVTVAVLPDGRVVTSTLKRHVFLWDPQRPRRRPSILNFRRFFDAGRVDKIVVLPDGRILNNGGDLLIWDPDKPWAAPMNWLNSMNP